MLNKKDYKHSVKSDLSWTIKCDKLYDTYIWSHFVVQFKSYLDDNCMSRHSTKSDLSLTTKCDQLYIAERLQSSHTLVLKPNLEPSVIPV